MSVNAGRKASGAEGIEALFAAVAMTGMAWDAIFITECDGKRSEQVSSCKRAGHEGHRHYPGFGSCAMAWIIHRRRREMCTGVRWRGRAGAVRLRPTRVHEGAQQQHNCTVATTLVGIHGGLTSEALESSLADSAILYRQRFRPGPGIVLGDINVDQLPISASGPFSERNGRSEHHREERERSCRECEMPCR